MADTMIKELKEVLALPMNAGVGDHLPSPEELKGMVLIKGKRITEEKEEEDDDDHDEDDVIPTNTANQASSSTLSTTSSTGSMKTDSPSKKHKASKIHPDLSAITYLGTGKVKAFTPEVSNSIPCDMMASYGETKVSKAVKHGKVDGWIEHNKNHLRCVY
jgi:hypothetical protein